MSAQPEPVPAREPEESEESEFALVRSHEDFDEDDTEYELDDGS